MRYLKRAAWLGILTGMGLGLLSVLPASGQDAAGKKLKILSTASLIGEVAPCG